VNAHAVVPVYAPVESAGLYATSAADNIGLSESEYKPAPTLNNPALGNDLKQREYEIIMNTLRVEGGSRKNTAERLGISARTLRYKIARLREEGYDITD
jgi:two-component system response regulator FlrC